MTAADMESSRTAARPGSHPRLVCFVNGIFSESIGGGDVYFPYIAHAALNAGYPLHFFGGHALKRYLERQRIPMSLTLTDKKMGNFNEVGSLAGQFRLLLDFAGRLSGTLRQLKQ